MKKIRTIRRTQEHNEILDNSFITPGRFRELDGLRGIAALSVVAYHFGYPAVQNYPRIAPEPYSIPLGELGVQLFFIISGYVILLSAIKSGSALKFGISRFARLYPTYWLALAVAAAVYFLYGNPGRNITVIQTLINTTMMQRFMLVDNVDQVYWTLAIELQFYLLMGFYLALRRGRIYRREITIGIFCWTTLGLLICCIFHPEASLTGAPKMLVWGVVAEHAALFSLGMVFFMYSHDRKFTWLMPYCAVTASINAFLMHDGAHGVGVAIICAVFFAVIYVRHVPFLARGPLHALGTISYPLYLGHAMLGYMLIDMSYPWAGAWGARILALTLVLLWAWCVHSTVETRVSAALRNVLARKLVRA